MKPAELLCSWTCKQPVHFSTETNVIRSPNYVSNGCLLPFAGIKSHNTSRESVTRTERQATRLLQTNNTNSNISGNKYIEGPHSNLLLLARPYFQQRQILFSRLTMCLMSVFYLCRYHVWRNKEPKRIPPCRRRNQWTSHTLHRGNLCPGLNDKPPGDATDEQLKQEPLRDQVEGPHPIYQLMKQAESLCCWTCKQVFHLFNRDKWNTLGWPYV